MAKLAAGDIAFGSNSWRGDHYEPHLRKAVNAFHIHRLIQDGHLQPMKKESAKSKVKVNLRDYIEENTDHNNMLLVHASVDVDGLRTNCIPEESEIDIHDLLGEQHAIAFDLGHRPGTQPLPAPDRRAKMEVLQECERNYKGEEGLCWDDLVEVVTELYPDPEEAMRPIRISRCDEAMQVYKDTDQNANLADFLADAMLWCERTRSPSSNVSARRQCTSTMKPTPNRRLP